MATEKYSLKTVYSHNTAESLWIIVDDHVYDLTKFLADHPGGTKPLLKYAGRDATVKFNAVKAHTPDVFEELKTFCIGTVLYSWECGSCKHTTETDKQQPENDGSYDCKNCKKGIMSLMIN